MSKKEKWEELYDDYKANNILSKEELEGKWNSQDEEYRKRLSEIADTTSKEYKQLKSEWKNLKAEYEFKKKSLEKYKGIAKNADKIEKAKSNRDVYQSLLDELLDACKEDEATIDRRTALKEEADKLEEELKELKEIEEHLRYGLKNPISTEEDKERISKRLAENIKKQNKNQEAFSKNQINLQKELEVSMHSVPEEQIEEAKQGVDKYNKVCELLVEGKTMAEVTATLKELKTEVAEPEEIKPKAEKIVKNEEPELVAFSEPEPIKNEEPELAAFSEPEPIKNEEPELAAFSEPEPIKNEEPELAAFSEPELIKNEEPELAAFSEPEPIKSEEPELAAFSEPEPIKDEEPELAAFSEPEPIKDEEPELAAFSEAEPVKNKEQKQKATQPKVASTKTTERKETEPKVVEPEVTKPVGVIPCFESPFTNPNEIEFIANGNCDVGEYSIYKGKINDNDRWTVNLKDRDYIIDEDMIYYYNSDEYQSKTIKETVIEGNLFAVDGQRKTFIFRKDNIDNILPECMYLENDKYEYYEDEDIYKCIDKEDGELKLLTTDQVVDLLKEEFGEDLAQLVDIKQKMQSGEIMKLARQVINEHILTMDSNLDIDDYNLDIDELEEITVSGIENLVKCKYFYTEDTAWNSLDGVYSIIPDEELIEKYGEDINWSALDHNVYDLICDLVNDGRLDEEVLDNYVYGLGAGKDLSFRINYDLKNIYKSDLTNSEIKNLFKIAKEAKKMNPQSVEVNKDGILTRAFGRMSKFIKTSFNKVKAIRAPEDNNEGEEINYYPEIEEEKINYYPEIEEENVSFVEQSPLTLEQQAEIAKRFYERNEETNVRKEEQIK